jgi:hypothetical protein
MESGEKKEKKLWGGILVFRRGLHVDTCTKSEQSERAIKALCHAEHVDLHVFGVDTHVFGVDTHILGLC